MLDQPDKKVEYIAVHIYLFGIGLGKRGPFFQNAKTRKTLPFLNKTHPFWIFLEKKVKKNFKSASPFKTHPKQPKHIKILAYLIYVINYNYFI